MNAVRAIVLVALSLTACARRPADVAAPETARPLALTVDAVAPSLEAGGVALGARGPYLLGRDGSLVAAFPGGARADLPAGRRFVQAFEVRALEGAGAWLLARDDSGAVFRLRGGGGLEPMNARLGLPARVSSFGVAGTSVVALADEGLFVVAAKTVERYPVSGRSVVGGAGGRLAVVAEDEVVVLDLGERRTRRYALESPRAAAITDRGALYVATERGLYRENGSGDLVLRYVADDALLAMAAEGDAVWFADGGRVGVVDDVAVALAAPTSAPAVDALAVSASALWIVAGGRAAHLLRPTDVWSDDLGRLVRAKCGGCHSSADAAGGVALAAPADFRSRAGDVRRVLTSGAMPPPESREKLAPDERARLLSWLDPARR